LLNTTFFLGFTGNLLDLQVGGVSRFRVSNTGTLSSIFVSGTGYFAAGTGNTIGTVYGIQSNLNIVPSAGSALFRPYEILYTINASGPQTGNATGIFLNATEGPVSPTSGLNGMTHNLMDLQTTISGVTTSRFKVDNTGTATISNINLGLSAGAGGILNLGNGGNGSAINAAGYQMYTFISRHRFDGDGFGSAFVGSIYIGANSATSNTRLQVLGVLGQNIVRFDDNTGTSRFIVNNSGVVTIGSGTGVNAIAFAAPKTYNSESNLVAIGNAGYAPSMYFSGNFGTTNFFNDAFPDRVGVNIGTTTNNRGALLRLGAGAAAANSAPLKFTAGTNLTTPENGAFEFDGSFLYFTIGGVRLKVTLAP
jgi:hypothetical protein